MDNYPESCTDISGAAYGETERDASSRFYFGSSGTLVIITHCFQCPQLLAFYLPPSSTTCWHSSFPLNDSHLINHRWPHWAATLADHRLQPHFRRPMTPYIVSCIPSFLQNLSLLINHQDETWLKHKQYQGAVNNVGGGDFKARKMGRHDGKLCQTRSPEMYVCAVFHPLPLRPDDRLRLIVNILLYLSCRIDIQNASGNSDILLQEYCTTTTLQHNSRHSNLPSSGPYAASDTRACPLAG